MGPIDQGGNTLAIQEFFQGIPNMDFDNLAMGKEIIGKQRGGGGGELRGQKLFKGPDKANIKIPKRRELEYVMEFIIFKELGLGFRSKWARDWVGEKLYLTSKCVFQGETA